MLIRSIWYPCELWYIEANRLKSIESIKLNLDKCVWWIEYWYIVYLKGYKIPSSIIMTWIYNAFVVFQFPSFLCSSFSFPIRFDATITVWRIFFYSILLLSTNINKEMGNVVDVSMLFPFFFDYVAIVLRPCIVAGSFCCCCCAFVLFSVSIWSI